MSDPDKKARRRVERNERKKHDPWFGKRRKVDMEGDRKKKKDKHAARNKNRKDWD